MEILIGSLSLILFILTYAVYFLKKKNMVLEGLATRQLNKIRALKKEEETSKFIVQTLERSIENLINTVESSHKAGHKTHLFFSQERKKEYQGYQQIFGLVIDEEIDNFVGSNIECTVFIDGRKEKPLSLDPMVLGRPFEIHDINCGDYKSRGVGTAVLSSLCSVLKDMGVQEVFARLSPIDYPVKEKLYRFYIEYNQFELVCELTEHSWGRVKKLLQ